MARLSCPHRGRARLGRLLLPLLVLAATLVLGCSALPEFRERGGGQWRPQTEPDLPLAPQPQVPNVPGPPTAPPPSAAGEPPAEPRGCSDPDPAVIETCLEPVSAVVALQGVSTGLAAERTTGRVLRVERRGEPTELASLSVDATADGGLTGLSVSPTYAEDELVFAYVTTRTDNRVVRIAPDESPEPVLTGIPRGRRGNAGAMTVGPSGALLVATGDADDPALAADPESLAGKVLRIDTSGDPAPGNPDPGSRVLARGLHTPGGLCAGSSADSVWVTDRAQNQDLLQRVRPGRALGDGEWVWPDQPGASGCVVLDSRVQVAMSSGGMYVLRLGPGGSFVGRPQTLGLERYGRLGAASVPPGGSAVWLATVNKAGRDPVSSDERVFYLLPQSGSGSPD